MAKEAIELHDISVHVSRRTTRSPPNMASIYENDRNTNNESDRFLQNNGASPAPAWAPLEASKSTWKDNIFQISRVVWIGPREPQDRSPRPIRALLRLEEIPHKLRAKMSNSKQSAFLILYIFFWLLLWSRTLLPYLQNVPIDEDGANIVSLTCGQADDFWKGKNDACGLDAENCRSANSEKHQDITFRCPALCDRGSWLYSSRAVGAEIIKYRGYFIGGGSRKNQKREDSQRNSRAPDSAESLSYPYRADSFPCGAGVHSGLISPLFGGCAKISHKSGPQASFDAKTGYYGVSDSIGFSSFFPFSYVFTPFAGASHCHDPRLLVLITNIILGAPLVFLAPGVVFYWTSAVAGFWTIVSATDPPVLVDPARPETFYELVSVGLERFLPTCFVLYVLWAVSVKRTFSKDPEDSQDFSRPSSEGTLEDDTFGEPDIPAHRDSPLTRLFLWYPLFWLGVLNNISFDRLPVDRLTWHDLQVQPGALITVFTVASVLIVCVFAQAYYVWLSGRFWRLLSVYGLLFLSLFILGILPGLTLRIHHYIFALVFIPGCSTRGRTALAFQGILLGLFLSGVARWGYASIAETNLSLLRGEPSGQIASPEIFGFSSGLLHWQVPRKDSSEAIVETSPTEQAKVSLLVNDIERFRGESDGTVDIATLLKENDELRELVQLGKTQGEVLVYLRLAKFSEKEDRFGDYTRAAVLKIPSFEFEIPPPGIT